MLLLDLRLRIHNCKAIDGFFGLFSTRTGENAWKPIQGEHLNSTKYYRYGTNQM